MRLPHAPIATLLTLLGLPTLVCPALAQPTIKSVVPANLATGVSPSAPVVFTFSEAMNPTATSATFTYIDFADPMNPVDCPTSPAWSAGNTILTCTPTSPFPNPSKMILWEVIGVSALGEDLTGDTSGMFTTGSGSGGNTGSGTNAVTSLSIGKVQSYAQTSASSPVPQADYPYGFTAITTLASNRVATAVSLRLPTGATINLSQNMFAPEDFTFFAATNNLAALDTAYPAGSYVFTLQATTPLPVTVTLPPTNSMPQPNAPHISNFAAAQNVTPGQAFTLSWDPFQNGAASDLIWVQVGSEFSTGNFGETNALKGTATSVVIPANVLQPNRTNDVTVGFYRYVEVTNTSANYVTVAYRASATQFSLITSGGGSPSNPPALSQPTWKNPGFQFQLTCSPNQDVTVEYSTTLLAGSWQKLVTTNSPTGSVIITDPRALSTTSCFYRARNGS